MYGDSNFCFWNEFLAKQHGWIIKIDVSLKQHWFMAVEACFMPDYTSQSSVKTIYTLSSSFSIMTLRRDWWLYHYKKQWCL